MFAGELTQATLSASVMDPLKPLLLPAPAYETFEFVTEEIKSGDELFVEELTVSAGDSNAIPLLISKETATKKDGTFGSRGRRVYDSTILDNGGCLRLAFRELTHAEGNLLTVDNSLYRMQVTAVDSVSGSLAALEAGSRAGLRVTYLTSSAMNDKPVSEHEFSRYLTYEVREARESFAIAGIEYPGTTFVIAVSDLSSDEGSAPGSSILYYNQDIGWVVTSESVPDANPGTRKYMRSWK